jgi:hypothetical protein
MLIYPHHHLTVENYEMYVTLSDMNRELRELRSQYATDPVSFAYDIMRVEFLTNQQEDLLRQFGEFAYCNMYQQALEEYTSVMMNPRLHTAPQLKKKFNYLSDLLEGHTIDDEMKKKYMRKDGFSISSGRDTGKSCILSMTAWWFLCVFEEPQGYIMAPTGQQAKAILMAEIAKWGNRKIENEEGELENAFLFRDQFEILGESIRFKAAPKERFIEVKKLDDKSSKEDQITSFSGFHSPQQLFFLDEAIKYEDYIIETITATNTMPMNFAIMIFNPVRPESYAVRSVFGDKTHGWIPLRWNCEDSNKPGMKNHIDKLTEEYGGKDNDLYRVNVQGLPPRNSSDAMFPMHAIEESRTRSPLYPESQYICIGHDVAGEGNDDSCTVVRRGFDVIEIHLHQGKDDFFQTEFLFDLYKKYQPMEINIDTIGIGRSVYSLLKAKRCDVARPIKVSKAATTQRDRFRRLRDQYYFKLRDMFKDEKISFSLKRGENHFTRVRRELIATGFRVLEEGYTKVHGKDIIKEKLGGKSPDVADALMLAFCGRDYDADNASDLANYRNDYWEGRFREMDSRNRERSYNGEKSWMVV